MPIHRKDIANIRQDYFKHILDEQSLDECPIRQFDRWFLEAIDSEVLEPNAMTLSTVSSEMSPSARIVLLKDIKPQGLTFFTNYNSRKGEDIKQNSRVALLFFWPELQRQVSIQGSAQRIPDEESTEYFVSRPKASQISAIASPQSQKIESRKILELKVESLEKLYADEEYTHRPDHWGGYLVVPTRVEYWQGRSNRLHDRIVYELADGIWKKSRLAP